MAGHMTIISDPDDLGRFAQPEVGQFWLTLEHEFGGIVSPPRAVEIMRSAARPLGGLGGIWWWMRDVKHNYEFRQSRTLLNRRLTDIEVVAWAAKDE